MTGLVRHGRALRDGPVAVHVPHGWHRTAKGFRAPVPGVTVAVAAAPTGAARGTGVGVGSSTMTPALLQSLAQAATGAVDVAGHGALRVGTRAGEVVAVPVGGDRLATVVCRGVPERRQCLSIAGTVSGGLAHGPSVTDRRLVSGALALTAPTVAAGTRALRAAVGGPARAAAARLLGQGFIAEQGALQAAPVSSGARIEVLLLASALGRLGSAWTEDSMVGSPAAARRVARARTVLLRTVAAVAALGLDPGASFSAGPSAPAS